MAINALPMVLNHLRRLERGPDTAQRTDRELLRAFDADKDQDAFAVVVTRHAPLVWGVCRRILAHHQDAEDAFQATFLILAQQAGSARWQASVGGWLYTVAQRLAVRARKQTAQRHIREREASRTAPADASLRELAAVVDEELRRLPAKFREPLLLHYLEGATAETAAWQLGLCRTEFYNRLAYGRELLREGLRRQGLSLAAPLLAAALAPGAEAASRSLIQATIRGVMGAMPKRVVEMTVKASGGMAIMNLKAGLTLGLLLGMAAAGMAMLTPRAPMAPLRQQELPAEPPRAEDNAVVPVDRYGDPLPQGAIARLGTLRFRTEAERANDLAFAPDGKTIAVASMSGVWLFDAATGRRTQTCQPLHGYPWQVAFSPDGKRLLAAIQGTKRIPVKNGFKLSTGVQIWDLASGHQATEVALENILRLGWTAEGEPVVACRDKDTIDLHEVATGKKRRFSAKDLSTPTSPVCAVGKRVFAATGNETGIIHVWDMTSGEERWTLQTGGRFTLSHSLVLSPDERWLASLTSTAPPDRSRLQVWSLTTGQARLIATGDQEHLASAAFSADGKTLATIGHSEVRFWDTASGQERGRLKGGSQSFSTSAVAFAPDGKTQATMENHGDAIHLWDLATGGPKPGPEGHSSGWVRMPVFSPDGQRVTTSGGLDGTIRVWETTSGRQVALLRRSPSSVLHCALSADGRTLVSCWDDALVLSDAATGREQHVLETNDWRRHNGRPNVGMLVSGDCRKAFVFRNVSGLGLGAGGAGAGGAGFESIWEITGWDTTRRERLFRRQLAYAGGPRDLVISPDGKILAVPGENREPMHLEDMETGERLLAFPTLKEGNNPLAFSPDGRLLLSSSSAPAPSAPGGMKRMVQLSEVLTAREVLALPVSIYLFDTVAISPDGRLLAMIAPQEGDPPPQQEILLWDLRNGKELHRFKGYGSSVTSLAFSPDSRRLISGLYNSALLVWDVPAPRALPAARPTAENTAGAWADLASADASRAFRARAILASSPDEALPYLQEHLHSAKGADRQRLVRLLADLDSEQFSARGKAENELANLGELAEPALRQMLANKPSLEVTRRVKELLERLRGPVTRPELLQSLRAVAVLEDIGTPAARRVLEQLANGAPEARLTREAKESLRRLDSRGSSGR
jgi:RNA polymerase sigma factor (sigma-70 family)